MTSTLRAQAAAAAVRECPLFLDPCDRSCSEEQIAICVRNDAAFYALGHAAGVEEGARRFAEAIQKDYSGCVYKKTWRLANACHRVLSSLAPGTVEEPKGG